MNSADPQVDQKITKPRRRINRSVLISILVIAAAMAFLLGKGLGDATVYFKTADQAVAEREELGTRRFRIEGVVVPGSLRPTSNGVRFDIEENHVKVDVSHRGDPPDLFRPSIPVVLEGRFGANTFLSDRIMVKHSEQYEQENPSRLKDYKK